MKCPVCGCDKFYVKNPDDEYEIYEFECKGDEVVFIDEACELCEDTHTYCDQCAWHGDYSALKNGA